MQTRPRPISSLCLLLLATALAGCGGGDDPSSSAEGAVACDAEPTIRTTPDGVPFVRTPDSCFEGLPDWPYQAQYVDIDGLRQAYVDEGPAGGPVVLLLHGQPSWSYLYRKMIPVLVDGGFRVIAMDHLGMGRSDKPIDIAAYSYLGHNDRLLRFIEALDLRDIHLFAQDWGSLIGLRVAGLHPERFAKIAIGNGTLPVIPAGVQPFPPVADPDELADITSPFAAIPAQQPSFYEGCDALIGGDASFFGEWMIYAMTAQSFHAAEVIEAMTWFDLSEAEEAAYDAPFPSRVYMAGPRVFPSLVNELPGATAEAWAGLVAAEHPVITVWAANDPGNLGQCATQDALITQLPGARGWPHGRLAAASHFLQDDQGPAIARRLVRFFADTIVPLTRGTRYCEVLLASPSDGRLEVKVYGTQNTSECPAEAWEALDAEALKAETGAALVIMNGPRHWLVDRVSGTGTGAGEPRTFGDLQMNLLATIDASPGAAVEPYEDVRVNRSTAFHFDAGAEIYELTNPDGEVYVMQAMAQIVDPTLTLADLPALADRLSLPEGWTYAPRTLDEPLLLRVHGQATVTQDELQNTYQRVHAGSGGSTDPPIELSTDLCDDPTKMAALIEAAASSGGDPSFGDINVEQVQRMIQAPTEGPFYMVNLIRYRDKAVYPDGRETELTGREANALYAPTDFLAAIGARPVFVGEVDEQIDGDEPVWHDVAIVEYPCPLALFAMSAHPDFLARAVHKDAGVERTIVMVTGRVPTSPTSPPPDAPYPATDGDPAFDLVRVMRFRDQALYEEGVEEAERTGREAWERYADAEAAATESIGATLAARFAVQGVFIGDERKWDEVQVVRMPSKAGYQAFSEDEGRRDASHHRVAALADSYSMITSPLLVDLAGEGAGAPLEVTSDGIGTLCQADSDCPGDGVAKCLSDGGAGGFCTREGCAAGECSGAYRCCHDCSPVAAAVLPFDGSACLPEFAVAQLISPPVSCTCD